MKHMIMWAYQYLKHYSGRNTLIFLSMGMLLYLPFGLQKLIDNSEKSLLKRANNTHLIVTSMEGGTDDVIEALYLKSTEKRTWMKYGDMDSINKSNLGSCIPILSGFTARKSPIIGTHSDYFNYRKLSILTGRIFQNLGECVIGHKVAQDLQLQVGDHIFSSPDGFFDIAGVYPLKMKISGILSESHSPDDKAIFTDIKTSWVIMGLGHGHQNLKKVNDPTLILDQNDSVIRATAKLKMYQEITPDNQHDFHFHGNMKEFPIRSILFVPKDEKSLTILRGRFENGDYPYKAIIPKKVVAQLLDRVFRLKEVFYIIYSWTGISTALILMLIFALTIKLRKSKIQTLYILGASKFKVIGTLTFELLILGILSVITMLVMLAATQFYTESFIQTVVF